MKTSIFKIFGLVFLTALLSAVTAIGLYRAMDRNDETVIREEVSPVTFARVDETSGAALAPDFIQSAATATPAVVHIQTTYSNVSNRSRNPLEEFFGMPDRPRQARGSGSGVLIAQDGYIVTNNHVVENANEIEVILPDKRSFVAKLIGRDPSTDLALIKINGTRFPVLNFGNSDQVRVGEWVLAVGYPLSLNTTVTAGIISAKGRSIGILDRPQDQAENPQGSTAIESFIQTDAAINPGNSGGALVNASGELIGINAAIASQTGGYQGYGFAIPVNLAKKVISDLRQYGEVRRGFLGVTFPAPAAESELLKQKGIKPGSVSGVYLTGVQPGSPAANAGLREGDIVQSIDGVAISSSSEFSERIARHRPGDTFPLTFLRNGSTRTINVTLKNQPAPVLADNNRPAAGATAASKLGASFAPIPDEFKQQYRLRSGIIVTEVQRGGLFSQIGIPSGTIIISINRMSVSNVNDLNKALAIPNNGMISINGITPDGSRIVINVPVGA